MILLVTPNLKGEDCALALTEATGSEVEVVQSLQEATSSLRANQYDSVVLDQYLLETETGQASTLMEHLGTAIPVQVNLAVSGMERMVREVRAALQRPAREQVIARRAAQEALRNELNSTVTALLLHCELALASLDLPTTAAEKLRAAHELVGRLRTQLNSESKNGL